MTTEPDKTRGRGRPRKFDEDTVRAAIMEVFWQKGYAATSLDDLSKATGLVRPSLYAAFGNKEAMFLRAMEDFVIRVQDALAGQVPPNATPEAALCALFEAMLDIYLDEGSSGACGCLVFSTAVAEAPMHPEIRADLQKRLMQTDQQFRRLVDQLAPKAPEASRTAAATLAAATLHSLGLRVRAGTERPALLRFIDQTSRSIASLL